MPAKNTALIKVHMDDSFITDLIDERDRSLERNRHLEEMVETQDQDLQAAAHTIRHLCANVEAKLRIIDTLHVDVDRLKQLITDAYNIHFCYGQNVSNETWCALSISTLADMQSIALDHAYEQEQEQKKGVQS